MGVSMGTVYNMSQQAVMIQEMPMDEQSRNKTIMSRGVAGTRLHSELPSSVYHNVEDAVRSAGTQTLEIEAVERMKSYWRVGMYFGAICFVVSTIMVILSYLHPKAVQTELAGGTEITADSACCMYQMNGKKRNGEQGEPSPHARKYPTLLVTDDDDEEAEILRNSSSDRSSSGSVSAPVDDAACVIGSDGIGILKENDGNEAEDLHRHRLLGGGVSVNIFTIIYCALKLGYGIVTLWDMIETSASGCEGVLMFLLGISSVLMISEGVLVMIWAYFYSADVINGVRATCGPILLSLLVGIPHVIINSVGTAHAYNPGQDGECDLEVYAQAFFTTSLVLHLADVAIVAREFGITSQVEWSPYSTF
mmetsp:Transcript_3277/g.4457  ORF Transcript_3277/g.4457 Transcript_3277/m.4457 type:complete len:364 (+) Transcript_3277:1-1092(+)